MRRHRRVLIANRGEIAIRIAQAAAGLGLEAVTVHAPADALSLHTRAGGRSHELTGGSPADPVAAYLDVAAIVAAARAEDCDCLHPGYGFLAESAELARRCAEAGITFVGPSPEALTLFGDKTRARDLARSLGIPVVEGSGPLATAAEAAAQAQRVGYPVMLKASAGGGGRGMRAVERPDDLAEAYEGCRREAQAAFGDGTVFLEQLLGRPRHVEVQVLADDEDQVVHLWERDCSVQHRNQKVVEIAPAPGLDENLRARILVHAVLLVGGGRYRNAGTVEFLVEPETGRHYFIECNPRIQVEHTITEQVTGIDLVEAQFELAAGASLASLGLGHQDQVPAPRGFAVQARVVARSTGLITGYKEPSGPGVRVDACGYAGYTPPPQFDPLLAKVIGSSSGSAPTLASALDRTAAALARFQITGLATNRAELLAILDHASVRGGDARTTLLAEEPGLLAAGAAGSNGGSAAGASPTPAPDPDSPAVELLDRQMRALLGRGDGVVDGVGDGDGVGDAPAGRPGAAVPLAPALAATGGEVPVACPMTATVIEVRVGPGDVVAAGDTLVVVTAMKMETLVVAPCEGVVVAVQELAPGDPVGGGQVVALIAPGLGDPSAPQPPRARGAGSWQPLLDDLATLHRLALGRLAPGSDDPGVVRQRSRGKLTCRERIDLVLDPGSFQEVGSIAGFASYDDGGAIAAFTPANHVGGWGTVEGRPAIVCADDFTSRGGHADGAIGAKSLHLDRLSTELRIPSIRLLDGSSGGGSVAAMVPEQRTQGESTAQESSGAITAGRPRVSGGGGSFLPGHLGSTDYTLQLSSVPVVNLLLGSVVGIGAAKAVLGHFSVMVRDIAQLFVAGPPVVSHAMGYEITKEDLGDWRIHCRNGSVDNLAGTEEEAVDQTRRFLSYLPSSVYEPPPVTTPPAGNAPDRRDEALLDLIPRKRTTTFDMRRAIELMADTGSFFEIGPLWGTDQITGFVRFDGHPMGVIASDSRHVNGGALTADGCDKLRRHLDLCDLFHIPVLNLVDNPGFAVGREHEVAGTIRKGGEWMIAFAQVEVPIFTVIMRRSFGVAGNNWATPRAQPSMRVVWPAADVGGIPPEGGIEAAYKRQLAEAADPAALRAELEARIESARGPIGPLSRFQMEEMIDPRHTRALVCRWIGSAYRLVAQPARLGPRPLGFRP